MPNFLDLRTAVLTRLVDIPPTVLNAVPELIKVSVRKIQEQHNFEVMRAIHAVNTVVANGNDLGAVPENWKEWRRRPYYVPEFGRSRRISVAPSLTDILNAISTDAFGAPQWVIEGPKDETGAGNFQIYPLPDGLSGYVDGEYRIQIPYWRFMTPLAADGDTNWFTVNADEWIIANSCAEGFRLNLDEARADRWENRAKELKKEIMEKDKMRQIAGVDTFVPHLDVHEPMLDD